MDSVTLLWVVVGGLVAAVAWLGTPAKARPVGNEAAASEDNDRAARNEQAARINTLQAQYPVALARGDLALAARQCEEALRMTGEAFGDTHELTLSNLRNLAEILRRKGETSRAEVLFLRAISLQEKSASHADGLPVVLGNLALLYADSGRPAKAEPLVRRQLELLRGSSRPDVVLLFNALNNLARLLEDCQRQEEAMAAFEQALGLVDEVLPKAPDIVVSAFINYAGLLADQGRYKRAGELYQRVLALRQSGTEVPPALLASTLHGIGVVYDRLGKWQQAADWFRRALRIKEEHLPAGHEGLLATRRCLEAALWRLQGEAAPSARADAGKVGSGAAAGPAPVVAGAGAAAFSLEQAGAVLAGLTQASVRPFATHDAGRARELQARSVLVPREQGLAWRDRVAAALPPGWTVFVGTTRWSGGEENAGLAELVVAPALSPVEAVVLARCSAPNHGMGTEAIRQRLLDLDRRHGLEVLSAESDSVGFGLLRSPEDPEALARELLSFCPELEEAGGQQFILELLAAPRRAITLWWD